MYKTLIHSPVGKLTLTSDGEYLTGLFLDNQKYFPEKTITNLEQQDNLEIFKETKQWLYEYFKGEKPAINRLKLKPEGTKFRKYVWEELINIPYGVTVTYKQISNKVAQKLEKEKMSAQAIGGAISHNPIAIIIPCHRVIGSNNSLTGYAGGLATKEYLLKLEKENIR